MTGKQALVLTGLAGVVLYLVSGHGAPAAPIQTATYSPPATTYAPPPSSPPPAPTAYVVQPGDGWYKIAQKNGVTLGALLAANGASGTDVPLFADQVLQLPTGAVPSSPGTVPQATARAPATPAPRWAPAPQPTFIPYQGNGLGPTLCNDGSISHSAGRGTCSHHGGIAR